MEKWMSRKKLPMRVIDRKTGKYKPGASGSMEARNFGFDTYNPKVAKVMAETDTSTGRTARHFLKFDKIKKARAKAKASEGRRGKDRK